MGKQYFLNYFEMFEFIGGLVVSGPTQLSFFSPGIVTWDQTNISRYLPYDPLVP